MSKAVPILVTGGKGMLGSALFEEASQFPHFEIRAPGRDELDVRDPAAISQWRDWVEGGWIIHCAALVNVEGCARDPDGARTTIVDGTRNVAKLASQAGARLCYPQSFLIYDGERNPIPEDEQPRPLSLYGRLKYEAEQIACDLLADPLIIRMAGFFGGAEADKNFVGNIIPVIHAAIKRGETRFDVGTRIWQPTWTRDLAFNTLHLLSRDMRGFFQMAAVGHATFADVAQEIAVGLGWTDHIEIVSVDSSTVSQSELGRRPDSAILSCERLTEQNLNLQRAWRPTLHAYLKAPYFNQYRLGPSQ